MTQLIEVVSVNVGLPTFLGRFHGKEIISGIHKRPVTGVREVRVTAEGLEGDGQADRRVHGDKFMKVYAYPWEHYAAWAKLLTQDLQPGIFGENLTVRGITETDVYPGQRWVVGDVILEVTQPRLPCYKLDMHLGSGMAQLMQQNGQCGWYFRVVRPGNIPIGSPLQVNVMPNLSIAERFAEKMQRNPEVPGPDAE